MENDTPKKPARKPAKAAPAKEHEGERIAKVMARVGLCSRRDAEIWIEQGRVAVNGEKLTSAARNVTPADKVLVDGKPLAARERTRLFMFHKPRGLVTTDRDPEGRPTVFDYIAEKYPSLPRLMSIGRLDINTEGLLLLTNDGGLARVLELPSTGWLRRYRARANGLTDQARLDTLAKGVTIDGVDYAGVEAKLDRVQGANVWISLGLREGKNREVKRLLEHLGLGVNRLIRLSYGPFQLGEMADGAVDEVRPRVLADQLGAKLAEEANVDFDGPTLDHAPAPEPESFARPKRGAAPQRGERAERGEKAPRKSLASQEKPEPRKHVSALRSDRVKAETGPRRRTERAATADRNGRTVVVERVSVARRAEPAPDTRNARRFRDEREQRETGETRFEGRKSAPRGERSSAPRGERSSAPRAERAERAPRAERPRGETGAAKTFRRGERDATGGAPRSEARPQRGERKFGDRPAGDRKFGDRPAGDRPRGDRPAGGKSFGDKPFGGRPSGGRPAGGKPAGGRPAGVKPSGGRPAGGKPAGGRPSGPAKPRGKR
jgi:23S rRNA pseudouridine2605 synthase